MMHPAFSLSPLGLLTCGQWATVCGSRSSSKSTTVGHGVRVEEWFWSRQPAVPGSVSQVSSCGQPRRSHQQAMGVRRQLGTYASRPTTDSRCSQERPGGRRCQEDRGAAQEGR